MDFLLIGLNSIYFRIISFSIGVCYFLQWVHAGKPFAVHTAAFQPCWAMLRSHVSRSACTLPGSKGPGDSRQY